MTIFQDLPATASIIRDRAALRGKSENELTEATETLQGSTTGRSPSTLHMHSGHRGCL